VGSGAWPFLVGGVICLVNSVNERDLNLLNSCANPGPFAGDLSRGVFGIIMYGINLLVLCMVIGPVDVLVIAS
jgi:hypothetical protein